MYYLQYFVRDKYSFVFYVMQRHYFSLFEKHNKKVSKSFVDMQIETAGMFVMKNIKWILQASQTKMHSSEVFGKLFPSLQFINKQFQSITLVNGLGGDGKEKALCIFCQLMANVFCLCLHCPIEISCIKQKSVICIPFPFGHQFAIRKSLYSW